MSNVPPLRVYAAASLQDALLEVGELFETATGTHLQHNFAGSNTLALQIEAALSADIFISADEEWVDYVIETGAAESASKRPILSNRLVVVGREDGIAQFERLVVLGELLGGSITHIALADPDAVPAGRYARAALQGAGQDGRASLWPAVREYIVPTADVRAALALAEADRRTVAIVYGSDALISDSVRVVHSIDPTTHPPIRYWAVPINPVGGSKRTGERGLEYLDFLMGREAQAVFESFGFLPLEDT